MKLAFIGLMALAATASADDKKAPDKATPEAAKTGSILLVPADLKWVDIPKRPGTQMALAEGDPERGRPTFL